MKEEIKIAIAFILDLIMGDPAFFPHPVRGIGFMISTLEKPLITAKNKRLAGLILVTAVVLSVYWLTAFLASLSVFIEIILIYFVFAVKSLGTEALKVYKCLEKEDLDAAKKQIQNLVSRDASVLDRNGVIRATIETVAENISDAVISPLFYLLIGGVPLAMAFKAASTIDSMIGYKNEKYLYFGWAGARLDDILNFIPARITGFVLIPLAAFILGYDWKNSITIVKRDRFNHASPNSAHGEAAAAGALGIQLGGPTVYSGVTEDKPFIGAALKPPQTGDIKKCIRIMFVASLLGLITGLGIKALYKWGMGL